jgi:hypothetical protein
MRTFTQKQNQPQKPVSSSIARPQMAAAGPDHRKHPILGLQRAIGNQAVQRMLQRDAEELEARPTGMASPRFGHDFSRIPLYPPAAGATKLAIDKPGDECRQEACRISEQVIRMPEPQLHRACACGGACRKCETEQPGQKHERLQPKRVGSSDLVETAVPPIFHEVQRSSGQPLDAASRVFMESRFGHEFSQVRVHTDVAAQASAAAEGALAYTAGRDVVFGVGQYRPNTVAGRWLIAHELAHVIQQQGSAPSSKAGESALEREAGEAGVRIALGASARVSAAQGGPAVQFLRVSNGGFGKALEDFTDKYGVEGKAIGFLKNSTTFMKLVATLDQHYVWPFDPSFDPPASVSDLKLRYGETERKLSYDPSFSPAFNWQWFLGPDGRLVQPAAAAGKRPLYVNPGESSFVPFKAPGNFLPADVISLFGPDTPGFIQAVAHEATHAGAFVGGAVPRPQTLVDEIEAGIQDEIAARKSEAKILGEIPDPKVKANISLVGSRDPREVERDVSPAFNLTYLELFFFGRELRDEQADEGLNETEALNIRNEVDKNPTLPPVVFRKHKQVGKIVSDYAKTWFARQTAVREWEQFMKNPPPKDPTRAAEREKLVQDHAKRFFKGKVSYRP